MTSIKANKSKQKQTKIEPFPPEKVYQEFRTISGYNSFEEYNDKVGNRHSQFENKEWVWEAYQSYRSILDNEHIDINFQPLIAEAYDEVIADESQDLSRSQLLSLKLLAKNNNILFCVGDHQQLLGSECIVPFIKSMYQNSAHVKHYQLMSSYRCPKKVVQFANGILQLKYQATGGMINAQKNELLYIKAKEAADEGHVYWMEKETELTQLINDRDNAHFAVVTSLEFFKEAQKLFGAERVFTAEMIKGLQYKHILLYKPLETKEFRESSKSIGPDFTLDAEPSKSSIAKKTNDEMSLKHSVAFNELFVASTRAQSTVTVFQPKYDSIRHIHTTLKNYVLNNNKATPHIQATPTLSLDAEWRERSKALRAENQIEAAKIIEARLDKSIPSTSATTDKKDKKPVSQLIPVSPKAVIPKKAEPKKAEPKKAEPKKAEPKKAEPKKAEPKKAEPKKAEPKKAEPKKAEPKKTEPKKTEPKKTEPKKIQTKKTLAKLDNKGTTILHKAVISDDMSSFLLLINSNVDLDIAMNDGATAAYIAAETGNCAMLRELHRMGADLNKPIESGLTPLHIAAMSGHISVLQLYKELKMDLNITIEDDGATPCLVAAEYGYTAVVTALHLLGADIHKKSIKNVSPIHAAADNGHTDTITELCRLGADPNARSLSDMTPVCHAAQSGYIATIKKLFELGANLNTLDDCEVSPAIQAATFNQINVLDELIKYNVDLNKPTKSGATPLYEAAKAGHITSVIYLLNRQVEQIPRQENLDQLRESLACKCRKQHLDKLERIISRKPPAKNNIQEFMPHEIAAIKGHWEVENILKYPSQMQKKQVLSTHGFFNAKQSSSHVQPSALDNEGRLRF